MVARSIAKCGAKDLIHKIIILLPPRTKKNSSQIFINHKTGKRFITPSEAFKQYQSDCGYFLKPLAISVPVTVKCLFYMDSNRKCDLTNHLSAICDILVHYGVVEDDNCKIIVSHDGSRVFVDKVKPRTEITITDFIE